MKGLADNKVAISAGGMPRVVALEATLEGNNNVGCYCVPLFTQLL